MNLAFVVNVYNDQHLIKRLLDQIRSNCDCQVIVIADGVKLEEEYKQNAIWFECDRAKAKGQKGLWTQRYLQFFLTHTNASHLLRVDPDTCIWRSFTLPTGDYDIFGNVEWNKYKYPYVRGGCIGFTKIAAQKIVDSGLLLDDRYRVYNYQRYKYYRWSHEQESDEEFAFQDWIIGDLSYKLKLKLKEWDEIHVIGNENLVPEVGNFAITHPHPVLLESEK